jgi:hypothetical protein
MAMDPSLALAALLRLANADADREKPPEARIAWLWPVAVVAAKVSRNRWELARLLALGAHEAHYEENVVAGRCHLSRWKCDNGHARSPWSVHPWCRRAWALPDGSQEALEEAAACAVRMLRWAALRGRGHAATPDHAAFAGYAARPWSWGGADERVRTTLKVDRMLAELAASVGAK